MYTVQIVYMYTYLQPKRDEYVWCFRLKKVLPNIPKI